MINLIQMEEQETPEAQKSHEGIKSYTFRLTHNAYGDTLENIPSYQLIPAGGYVSFPINKLIQEKEAKVTIEWTWYKTYGASTSTETELKGIEVT